MGGQPSRRTGLAAGAQWEAGGDPSSQPVSTGLGLLASRWPELWLCLGNRPGQGRGALCPSPFSTPTKPGAPSVRLPHSRTQNTVYSTLPGLGDPDRPRSPSRLLCLRLPCSPAPLLIPTSRLSPICPDVCPPHPPTLVPRPPVCPDLPLSGLRPSLTPHLGLSHSASPSLPPSLWLMGPKSAWSPLQDRISRMTPH